MKLRITIEKLEELVKQAKKQKEIDSSLSSSLLIEFTHREGEFSELQSVWLESEYSDCNGKKLK